MVSAPSPTAQMPAPEPAVTELPPLATVRVLAPVRVTPLSPAFWLLSEPWPDPSPITAVEALSCRPLSSAPVKVSVPPPVRIRMPPELVDPPP